MLRSQLPIVLRMTKQRSKTLALTFRVYLFTIFSGHRPVQRECARTGLRSHARCLPYQVLQPVKVGHTTGVYDPYSFRIMMWVLSVKVLCDGTYGLSSLSEKTRKSNHLQMSFQRQHPERWSGRSLNPGPPARQTGALPFELTRRRLNLATHTLRSSILLFWYTALGQSVRHKWKKTATQFLKACWQARLGVSETESPGDLVVKRRKQAVTCLSICSITLSGNITPKTERNMFL